MSIDPSNQTHYYSCKFLDQIPNSPWFHYFKFFFPQIISLQLISCCLLAMLDHHLLFILFLDPFHKLMLRVILTYSKALISYNWIIDKVTSIVKSRLFISLKVTPMGFSTINHSIFYLTLFPYIQDLTLMKFPESLFYLTILISGKENQNHVLLENRLKVFL